MSELWRVRVDRKRGVLLPISDGLIRRRWVRFGVALMRLDHLLFRLGLV
jgi:hypothetical protein